MHSAFALNTTENEIDADAFWFENQVKSFFKLKAELRRQARYADNKKSETKVWLENNNGSSRKALWGSIIDAAGLHCWEELNWGNVVIRKYSLTDAHTVVVNEYHEHGKSKNCQVTMQVIEEIPHPKRPLRMLYSA